MNTECTAAQLDFHNPILPPRGLLTATLNGRIGLIDEDGKWDGETIGVRSCIATLHPTCLPWQFINRAAHRTVVHPKISRNGLQCQTARGVGHAHGILV